MSAMVAIAVRQQQGGLNVTPWWRVCPFLAGYYVRDIPVWIGWLKYLSFLYWGESWELQHAVAHPLLCGVLCCAVQYLKNW